MLPLSLSGCTHPRPAAKATPQQDLDVADVVRLPQNLDVYAEAAGDALELDRDCRDDFLKEFREHYFKPWTSSEPCYDLDETRRLMKGAAHSTWYGVNHRRVERKFLQELLADCNLQTFPSRRDRAIAVAQGHLRGLPTVQPLFQTADDYPFDRLQYPQVKLNEPLRVLHATRDGVWLFVESVYSNGWLPARDVALVDQKTVDEVMAAPLLVITRDGTSVHDRRGAGYRAKLGTLFPAHPAADGFRPVLATAAAEGRAQLVPVSLPTEAAAPFPLPFNKFTVPLVANQLAGKPYGWGEIYGLRDCSAMLRDFFLPFGIWLPRTSSDQIASAPGAVHLSHLSPQEKEATLKSLGRPFFTLLFKPGHIMLYIGTDQDGRALLWHGSWSVRLSRPQEHTLIVGKSVVTTMEPGKELGLVPGTSIAERASTMTTLSNRCRPPDAAQTPAPASVPAKEGGRR